ncbi:CHAD domain-containing protein [Stenotrophomonas sp. MMGLT7]|uniref:CHAD domain-containing protein n=1 Tax=Stenotrophomonas sp. MMGLT7 TaxID=2901227 RepID=UPI001E41B2A0|nr:CHAD domain-containing protein [Stenotrophomonas sp. MMGLT7]MCD7096837.1 CHAD domain-containing protein [Stenotrophomonas sp. MMGLT7]
MNSDSACQPGTAAQALARRECRIIARALARKRNVHAAVHSARKAIRRLRSLLALVKHRFDEVAPIDRRLQKLGDGLSALRDAHVTVDVAQALAARDGTGRWQPAIDFLVERRDRSMARALAADPGFRRRQAIVERVAADLEALDWRRLKRSDLRAALRLGQARLAKAEKRARQDPSPQNLHRFRRRVRRLRMQRDALGVIAPEIAGTSGKPAADKQAKALRKLSDRLGWLQDLRSVRNLLRRAPGIPDRGALLLQLHREMESNAMFAPHR